ncbi:MAG: glycosyltransferase [Bacteroidales bacterium]|nr:glycosyltransferase [Bacteroidales bacterium]
MNIIIFNNSNPFYSSGIIGLDLLKEFQKRGHIVKLLVNEYSPDYPDNVISIKSFFSFWQEKILRKIRIILKVRANQFTVPKYRFHDLNEKRQYYKTELLLRKAKIKPDIIFILFIKGFINARNIFELNKLTGASIFWLIYDMAPFTGGCHYAWECKGYQNSCGNCPGLYSSDQFDVTFQNLIFKKKYLAGTNLQILSGSEWQFRQARNSSLFKEKLVHKILLPINPSIFKVIDKNDAKLNLGIPTEKKVLFFGSMGLTDERKGIIYLIESFRILKKILKNYKSDLKEDILLLIAGDKFEEIKDELPFESFYLGIVDNLSGIASAFQAADIFVCPSVEDSGPMMINQSIMCGTPVVSFEMGVALDLVKTGTTGYRARNMDSKDLAEGIFSILVLNKDDYKKLSRNCVDLGQNLCSSEVQIGKIERIIGDSIIK